MDDTSLAPPGSRSNKMRLQPLSIVRRGCAAGHIGSAPPKDTANILFRRSADSGFQRDGWLRCVKSSAEPDTDSTGEHKPDQCPSRKQNRGEAHGNIPY